MTQLDATQLDAQVITPSAREQAYRRNFRFFLTDTLLFNLAMGIIGATTVIPDFIRQLTNSEILIGLSGSLFSIGYMLPQLLVARYIVRFERKKWWFVGPNMVVRPVILLLAALIVWLGQGRPEAILIAFFICYGIAAIGDGLVGVPWADLAGTSLDNRWRARMFGLGDAVTGVVMLAIAPLIGVVLSDAGPAFPNNYALLFGVSGLLFTLSVIPGIFIRELPGGKAVERLPAVGDFISNLGTVLRQDRPYRAFIVLRLFTSLFTMALPFYIGYATVELGLSSAVAVPVLLAMQTIGALTGALLYTWIGARDNLFYIRLALVCAAMLPVSALLAGMIGPLPLYIGFLVSGLASGTLLFSSYTNWIVGYAPDDQRPIYVGLSNTAAAVFTLLAPFIAGTIAQGLGYRPLFAVAFVMALSALFVASRYLRDRAQAEPIQV